MFVFSAPESDDFVESVLGLRRALGWVVEIPRHGPGCRQALEQMQDKPQQDDQNTVTPTNPDMAEFDI